MGFWGESRGAYARRLAVVFLVAAVWRLGYMLVVRNDLSLYHIHEAAALNLLAGKGLVVPFGGHPDELVPLTAYPPGYAMFLAGVFMVFGRSLLSVQLVQIVLGALASTLLAVTVSFALKRTKTGFWSGIVAAVLPISSVHDVYVDSNQGLPLFLTVLAMALWYMGKRSQAFIWYVFVGLALGAATEFRSESLPILLLLALMALAQNRGGKGIKLASAILLGGIVILVPWTVRNATMFGAFSPTSPGTGRTLGAVIGKAYPDPSRGFAVSDGDVLMGEEGGYADLTWPDPFKRDARKTGTAIGFMVEHPLQYAMVLVRNLPFAWFGQQLYLSRDSISVQSEIRSGATWDLVSTNPLALLDRVVGASMALVVFGLAAVGLFTERGIARTLSPYLVVIAFYLIVFLPMGVLGRYTMPAYVLMIPFSVVGAHYLVQSPRLSRIAHLVNPPGAASKS